MPLVLHDLFPPLILTPIQSCRNGINCVTGSANSVYLCPSLPIPLMLPFEGGLSDREWSLSLPPLLPPLQGDRWVVRQRERRRGCSPDHHQPPITSNRVKCEGHVWIVSFYPRVPMQLPGKYLSSLRISLHGWAYGRNVDS